MALNIFNRFKGNKWTNQKQLLLWLSINFRLFFQKQNFLCFNFPLTPNLNLTLKTRRNKFKNSILHFLNLFQLPKITKINFFNP